MLIGYGTPSTNAMTANAIRNMPASEDIPIKVVIFGPHNRCRYTLYFMNKTITRYYDNATHFSLQALYELHLIYLNAQRQTEYAISKQRIIDDSLIVPTKIRLIRLMVEEHGIQAMQREEKRKQEKQEKQTTLKMMH
jgi:hypothetical protein